MTKVLHIFDMDDTLLDTPMMVDFIETDDEGNVKNPSVELKSHMDNFASSFYIIFAKELKFKRSGDFIAVVNAKDSKPLGTSAMEEIEKLKKEDMEQYNLPERTPNEMKRAVSIKDGIMVLEPFGGFHKSKKTVGSKVNPEVAKIYQSVENKMILTGRDDDVAAFDAWKAKKEKSIKKIKDSWQDAVERADTPEKKAAKLAKPDLSIPIQKQIQDKEKSLSNMKGHIMNRIKELGLDYPNYGLVLYNSAKGVGIPKFKSSTIEKAIKDNGFTEVHYYEDRKDWLISAQEHLAKVLPNINFVPHFITNIKDEKSL